MRQFEYPLDLHCSQTSIGQKCQKLGLNTLWIYTALKLWDLIDRKMVGLNTLWIYTALKQDRSKIPIFLGLNTLWIYTALKPFTVH